MGAQARRRRPGLLGEAFDQQRVGGADGFLEHEGDIDVAVGEPALEVGVERAGAVGAKPQLDPGGYRSSCLPVVPMVRWSVAPWPRPMSVALSRHRACISSSRRASSEGSGQVRSPWRRVA
jgi:hypothetical protein